MAARDAGMQVRLLTVDDLAAYRALHRFGLREAPQALQKLVPSSTATPHLSQGWVIRTGDVRSGG